MLKTTKMFAVTILCCCQFISTAQASTLFNEAMGSFKQNRFHAAADLFQQVIHKEPANIKAYFYLGSTLEQLKDRDGAKAAYEGCFRLNPFSVEGRHAKQNLLNLADEQAALAHPHDSPRIITKTVNTINQQAYNLGQDKINYADNNALFRLDLGNIEIQRILHDRNMQLINLRYAGNYGNRTNRRPNYDPWGEEEVSNLAIINTYYQQIDAMRQSNRYRAEGQTEARYAQESANELVSELGQQTKSEQPQLRGLGTNLYVRNYSKVDQNDLPPQDPLLELKATQGKLTKQTAHLTQSRGY